MAALQDVLRLVSNTQSTQACSSEDLAAKVRELDAVKELTQLCKTDAGETDVQNLFRALRGAPEAGFGSGGGTGEGDDDGGAGAGGKWGAVAECVIKLTANKHTTEAKAKACLANVKVALPWMAAATLSQLVQALITTVNDGAPASGPPKEEASPLDLLPSLLSLVGKKKSVPFTRGAGPALTITGEEYRRNALGQLVSAEMGGQLTVEIAKVLCDIPLGADVLHHFLSKCVEQFDELEPQALPALMHQLLLLVNNQGAVAQRLVLGSIVRHFDGLDARSQGAMTQSGEQTLRSVEGTVILQVNFAAKQDQKLGREYMRLLNSAIAITPFSLAVLFSLSRISYFEDEAFKLLKGAVTSCHTDQGKRASSQWIDSLGSATDAGLDKALLKTVTNGATWDTITQGLVKFGFCLVDSTGAFGQSAAQEFASDIGFQVVVKLFDLHEMVRSEILEQCFTRIITHAKSVDKVVCVLAALIKENPQDMMEFMQQIRELFDYVSSLSPSVASQLLKAVQPLMRLRQDLVDHIVLVFRKAVFNKEPNARLIAVTGFVELVELGDREVARLGNDSMPIDEELTRVDQQATDMRMQAFGLFRRCLTQQFVVREKVYSSLASMFATSPASREAIVDLLAGHWNRYYMEVASSQDGAPINLDRCLRVTSGGEATVEEPLAALISCIHQCCQHRTESAAGAGPADDGLGRSSTDDAEGLLDDPLARLSKELNKVTEQMAANSSDDFGIDESTVGQNVQRAALLQTVCEAVMECSVMSPQTEEELQKRSKVITMRIFEGLHSQCCLSGGKKKKGGATQARSQAKPTQRVGGAMGLENPSQRSLSMSLPCLTRCLGVICNHKDLGMPSFMKLMLPFRAFVYKSCMQILSKKKRAVDMKDLRELAVTLAKALQKHRDEALSSDEMDDEGDKKGKKKTPGTPATVLALQSLSLVVQAAQSSAPIAAAGSKATMLGLLAPCSKILGGGESAAQPQSIDACFKSLLKLLEGLLSDGNTKEPEILLGIMWGIVPYMERDASLQHAKEFDRLLDNKFRSVNNATCKAAVRMVLRLNEQQGGAFIESMETIATDLKLACGPLSDVEEDPSYGRVISDESAATVAPVLFSSINGVVDEIGWALSTLSRFASCRCHFLLELTSVPAAAQRS